MPILYIPSPDSVLEESQTFDTLYPVSIRLINVWLKWEWEHTCSHLARTASLMPWLNDDDYNVIAYS